MLPIFSCKLVEARIGTIIHGQLDQLERGVLFTDAFVARQMACIRGVFSAITKYVNLSRDLQLKLMLSCSSTNTFHCYILCFVY